MPAIHCRECDERFHRKENVIGSIVICPGCKGKIKIRLKGVSFFKRRLHKPETVFYLQGFLIGLILVMLLSILFDGQLHLGQ